ncbi:MAG: M23 family metallopeptidase [Chthoniobacterales bacterium]|nr:M23 family metallopeptidase [Chthoniobacterales bacterium]
MKLKTSKGRTTAAVAGAMLLVFLVALAVGLFFRLQPELQRPAPSRLDPALRLVPPIELAALPTATRFDFPLGSEHGALAYNAQPFPENRHLGDDLNGIGGQNSDLGDPIYVVADGRVLLAQDGGPGWGNVILVLHAYEENGTRRYLHSFYGHVDEIGVEPGQNVVRGQQIGTVGNAGGRYWAHLHLEMREFVTPFVGPGYREDTRGWINPSEFIQQHRDAPEEDVGRSGEATLLSPE